MLRVVASPFNVLCYFITDLGSEMNEFLKENFIFRHRKIMVLAGQYNNTQNRRKKTFKINNTVSK